MTLSDSTVFLPLQNRVDNVVLATLVAGLIVDEDDDTLLICLDFGETYFVSVVPNEVMVWQWSGTNNELIAKLDRVQMTAFEIQGVLINEFKKIWEKLQ